MRVLIGLSLALILVAVTPNKSVELSKIDYDWFEPQRSSAGGHSSTAQTSTAAAELQPAGESKERSAPASTGFSTNDLCLALAAAAVASDIPVPFFARLIWQESHFKSDEISSAGAQGVAQFMPTTAAEMGLDDPFDPLQALPASAKFIRKLQHEFGNLGLAAAAYNAGSGRVQKWLARRDGLPTETRNYVRIITGSPAESWIAEDKTIGLPLALPPQAPCEGVGSLSRVRDFTQLSVALAPGVRAVLIKAQLDAERAAKASAEAELRAKKRRNTLIAKFVSIKSKHKKIISPAKVFAYSIRAKVKAESIPSHPGQMLKSPNKTKHFKVASAGR